MSYSQLILSDRPYGYWEYPQFSQKNLLTDNQYSLESSTSGWSAVDSNTSISRVTSDSYVGSASLLATANSTSEIETRVSSGSRIQIIPGVRYSMIARVKRVVGSRNASIRIEYYTTQNGSTLSEPVRSGEEFQLSDSEWTTIYHTDLVATPNDSDYFMSWGIITDSGDSGDTVLVDGIQFYEGTSYKLLDRARNNDSDVYESYHENIKPIIFGTSGATKLYSNSNIIIDNTDGLFISGAEGKSATLDFWFSIEKPPSYRHMLVSIGSFIQCYVERDRLFIEYDGEKQSIQVVDWESQHYVAILYSPGKVDVYLDDRVPASISLDQDFRFPDVAKTSILPSISFGPSSEPRNLIFNPSFNSNSTGWEGIGAGTSISVISSDSFSGPNCLEVTKSAIENSGVGSYNRTLVSQYEKYQASVYVKIPSGEDASTIQLRCTEYSTISSSTPVSVNIQDFYVSSASGWQRISLNFSINARTQYVDFEVVQPTAGNAGSKFLIDGALFEKSSHLMGWDELSDKSDPLLISSIGLYPYSINNSQISKRISYATNDISDLLSVRYFGDMLDPFYNSIYSILEVDVTNIKPSSEALLQNLIYTNNGLYMPKIQPISVISGPSGGYFNIDSLGIKFNGDCYAVVDKASTYFSPAYSTVRMQVDIDTSTGNGVILSISPVYGYYALLISKESNKIIGKLISDFDDSSPQELFSTATLSDDEYNIALNFVDRSMNVLVGAEEFNNIAIPTLGTPTEMYLGNIPGTGLGYPDYIRNFCIDAYTEFSNIDWYDPGIYMARFNENLNISQRAKFEYSIPKVEYAENSIVTFNEAGKADIIINDEYLDYPSHIPMNYASPDDISFIATSSTENAYTDAPKFNNIFVSAYGSLSINSSLGNFRISSEDYNPYIIKSIKSNVLSHDSNVGLRFIRGVSSGCAIDSPTSTTYQCLEFIFKIDKFPNRTETYTIFDLEGLTSTSLLYTDGGIEVNGSYQLFIDGLEITDPTLVNIVVGEFYHVVINFGSSIDRVIRIGTDKSSANGINGSIGKLSVYENSPPSISSFARDKYQDLIGKITYQLSGGSVSITDEPATTQEYYRDSNGEYYEMIQLPKVKFVVSSWEEIDLEN